MGFDSGYEVEIDDETVDVGEAVDEARAPRRARATGAVAQHEDGRPRYWHVGLAVFAGVWSAVVALLLTDPATTVASNWPLVPVGAVGALIGNLTAVGGGLVFVPVLMLVYGVAPVTALKLAIASQCFGMTSGAIAWWRRGSVPTRALRIAVPALLIGSTISTLVIRPNAMLVKGLFGPVSIVVGALTLLMLGRHGTHDEAPERARVALFVASLVGGLVTGWVAIGEGEIVAATLMLGYGLKVERGVGLGVVLLSINSLYLLALHELALGGIPWDLALFTGFGCVFGARLAPFVAARMRPRTLKLAFATIAIVDGIVILAQFLTAP